MKIFKSHLIFFFLISILLTILWFRHGNILGGGEAGAPFYDLSRLAAVSIWAWGDQTLGNVSGLTVASGPLFFATSWLQSNNIPGFLIQAILTFLELILGLISMYLFTKQLFKDQGRLVWVFSSLFYMFNMYSLMNIWNRFLPNTIVFYNLLPFMLWLYIRGLERRQYYLALTGSLLTAVFSYAFGAPAQTVIFWGLLAVFGLYHSLAFGGFRFMVSFTSLWILSWILFNFWWISQELHFRFSLTYELNQEFFSDLGNIRTLEALSQTLGQIRNLFILQHGTFFTQSVDLPYKWPLFYSHPLTLIIQWIVILSTLFIAIKKRNHKWVGFLLVLFILAIFISKGSGPPLGEAFRVVFKDFSVLQFFRNPFEKLGLILPLVLSPLFGLAVYEIYNIFKKRSLNLAKVFSSIMVAYLLLFVGFPYWTSLIFSSGNPPVNDPSVNYQVLPPDYYEEASKWLSSQPGTFRFATFPLGGEGIFYKWPKGYVGIEQSSILFKIPSISYSTTIPFYQKISSNIERWFLNEPEFYKIAAALNVDYVMYRPDIDHKRGGMRDPKRILEVLEEKSKDSQTRLTFANEFGPLRFYKFDNAVSLPRFYPSASVISTNQGENLRNLIFTEANRSDVLIRDKDVGKEQLSRMVQGTVLHSESYIHLAGPEEIGFIEDPNILPYTDRGAGSAKSILIGLKEAIAEFSALSIDQSMILKLSHLGKRLVETRNSIRVGDFQSAGLGLDAYQLHLKSIEEDLKILRFDAATGEDSWKPYIQRSLGTHIHLLEMIKADSRNNQEMISKSAELQNTLLTRLIELKSLSHYRQLRQDNFQIENRQVYTFEVKQDGKYELIFPEKDIERYFIIPEEVTVQLDNEITKVRPVKTHQGYLGFGEFKLSAGVHEFSFNLPEGKNLLDVDKEFSLRSNDNGTIQEISINNFLPGTDYLVSMKYRISSGAPPKVLVVQNTDPVIDIKLRAIFERNLSTDDYWFEFRDFSTVIRTSPSADSADLIFTIDPWNDCARVFYNRLERCKEEQIRKQFDRVSESQIRDLSVTRTKFENPILKEIKTKEIDRILPVVTFEKINQTKYKVRVQGGADPFLLVFSELYNPDWKASIENEDKSLSAVSEDRHILVNGYANAWIIDKEGDYSMVIEYWPQNLLYQGYTVSGIGILVGVVAVLYLVKRRGL